MAFMTGKLKVSGNMAKLMMNQAMLGQFAAASAGVQVEY
jgi:putative sterol carrier protein